MSTKVHSKKMVKFQIICLQVCFLQLFMNVEFSNAINMKVDNPDALFEYSASLSALFVKSPLQNYYVQHIPARPMHLYTHRANVHEMSIYELNSPYTLFSFKARFATFEVLLVNTMSFKVEIDGQLWGFRCMFTDEQAKVDIMYIYLSLFTAQGSLKFKMDIDRVESYTKVSPTSEPLIYNIQGLNPGRLYESNIITDDDSDKLFDIKLVADDVSNARSRLAFRTGFFRMKLLNNTVVVGFGDFPGFYYIFYFCDSNEALTFARTIVISDSYASNNLILEIPPDLYSYLNRSDVSRGKQPMLDVGPSWGAY